MKAPAADTTIAAAALAGAVIADLVFAAAATADELEASVEQNRPVLDWIGSTSPQIRDQLRDVYRRRRAQLVNASIYTSRGPNHG